MIYDNFPPLKGSATPAEPARCIKSLFMLQSDFFFSTCFPCAESKSNFYLITPSITVDGAKQFTAAALMAKTSFHKAFNALVTIISNKKA